MKNKNYPEQDNRSKGFIILFMTVAAGILIGAVYCTRYNAANPWIHQYFLPEYSGNTVYEVFRNTFVSLAAFTVTAFLIGLSAFGQPVGVLMLLYRGFGIGIAAASAYLSKGLHGIPTVFILILPECTAAAIISVLAVRELMRLSKSMFMFIISDSYHTDKSFKLYCLEFIVLIIASLLVAVLATVLNYIFSGLR
ncbi:MAG: stage II sporulation protein M [Ruminococcus sp.]|nr:stage II sporulation protein M [Ruminococcus sp.]